MQDTNPIWLPQIVPHLKGGNLYGYIDGSFPCLSPTISSTTDGITSTQLNPAFLHWTMQDQIILGANNYALSKKMPTHVTRCTTSRAAWITLETLFTTQSKARTMQVHFQSSFLKKGNSTIVDYFQKFQAVADALVVVGNYIDDFEQQAFLLASLGSDYDPFVTSITTRADPLSIEALYGHLLMHEMRLDQHQSSVVLSVFGENTNACGSSFWGRCGSRPFRPHVALWLVSNYYQAATKYL